MAEHDGEVFTRIEYIDRKALNDAEFVRIASTIPDSELMPWLAENATDENLITLENLGWWGIRGRVLLWRAWRLFLDELYVVFRVPQLAQWLTEKVAQTARRKRGGW